MKTIRFLKTTVILAVFAYALIFVAATVGAHDYPVDMQMYGDCNIYGQRAVVLRPEEAWINWGGTYGEFEGSWGSQETAMLPSFKVVWGYVGGGCCYWLTGSGREIVKADYCSPEGGPGPKSDGGESPKPVALPKKQWYLTYAAHGVWCAIYVRTPIVDIAEWELCFLGNPSVEMDDFCMRSNYWQLPGCRLKNAVVIRLWEWIR